MDIAYQIWQFQVLFIFSATRRYRSDECDLLSTLLIVSTELTDVTLVSEDTCGDEEEDEKDEKGEKDEEDDEEEEDGEDEEYEEDEQDEKDEEDEDDEEVEEDEKDEDEI